VEQLEQQVRIPLNAVGASEGQKSDRSDPTVRSDRSEVNRIQNDTTTAKVLMIVHKTLAADERRKKNVVAVGIPETTDVDDREAFLQICEENLGVKPPYICHQLCPHRSTF